MTKFPHIDLSKFVPVARNEACPWGGKREDIYEIPLELLHFNKDNGRIASWVSGHESDPNQKRFEDMTLDEWNDTLQGFILESSSKDENNKTMNSILQDGQLKIGAILADGTIVAGNRRCSILRQLLKKYGDYGKFGVFRCAVFDVPNTAKELKRLETLTQYHEVAPVAYGPIERLVDFYNNVLAEGHPYEAADYRNFLGLTNTQMSNLSLRAEILVDFLSFIGKPGNYEIARIKKLDGPINELAGLRKKIDFDEWNRIKPSFYKSMQSPIKEDKTRVIRAMIKNYQSHDGLFEADLAKIDEELLKQDAATFGSFSTKESVLAEQKRVDAFIKSAYQSQKETARQRPLLNIDAATESIAKIDVTGITFMTENDREEFFAKVDLLIKKLNTLTKDKF